MNNKKYYTDYPVTALGDAPWRKAPIRPVTLISYDGDKYCNLSVSGVVVDIKSGYIYKAPGRCGQVERIGEDELQRLFNKNEQ